MDIGLIFGMGSTLGTGLMSGGTSLWIFGGAAIAFFSFLQHRRSRRGVVVQAPDFLYGQLDKARPLRPIHAWEKKIEQSMQKQGNNNQTRQQSIVVIHRLFGVRNTFILLKSYKPYHQ